MNKLIFGADSTEGIVNITLKENKVSLYKEELDGSINVESFDYTPWVLSPVKVKSTSERLKGDQYWKYLTPTTCDKFEVLQESWNKDLWIPRSIEECVTLCEGFTYFKNRRVEDISILSFDIETSGLTMDKNSKVYLISNTIRNKDGVHKHLFSLEDYADQEDLISNWCYWVREVNPSILCGHNIFSYDLPFLTHCFGKDLPLGRDGSSMKFDTKVSRFRKDGSQQYDYHNARIVGREIIDTFFLSIKYDIARDFPSYGLKPIVKFLGLEKDGRSFIDASKITQYYNNRKIDPETWNKVKDYALDDSEDSLKLYDKMIPAYFYLNQSIPKTFQQMINEASGSHLDALMIRSYLQDGYSQPRTSGKAEFEGAISMGRPGVYNWVAKADVASLYPSIMLEKNIHDNKKDPNNYMIQALTYFRDERLRNKKLAEETGDRYYDDMQNAQKIMINSMYGFLGASYLLYNYPEGASAVTRRGRELLLQGVEYVTGYTLNKVVKEVVNEGTDDEEEKFTWVLGDKVGPGKGFELVNVDTDSFSVTPNRKYSKSEFKQFLTELNSTFPELIKWADDGIYEKVIVIRAKNYVLVKSDEYLKPNEKKKPKYKGSAITDQKKEPALTEMLEKMVKALLADENSALPLIYNDYIKEATHISDISRWAAKKTVTKSVLSPKRLTEQKILDAMEETIQKGIEEGYQEGDKVWLYNAVEGMIQEVKKGEAVFYKDGTPKMIPNRILRDVRLYKHDQDTMHYVDRVYSTTNILSSVIDMNQFPDYTLKSNLEALNNLTKG